MAERSRTETHPASDPRLGLLPRRFQPQLTLGFQQDLSALAADVAELPSETQRQRLEEAIDVVDTSRIELSELGVLGSALQPTVAYSVALRLLRDLLGQGWELALDDEGILLRPPIAAAGATDDPSTAKAILRQSFSFARKAQLAMPATASFIEAMERRGISQLFADGQELAARLEVALKDGDLAGALVPSLELVSPEAHDQTTGIRLQDVWRYARHFWSIPYQSTPGRNLFYLVRDDAGPTRPIIGIAALGNAIIGLAQRDDALGWSAASIARRLTDASVRERRRLARHLVEVLKEEIAGIYVSDLELDLDDPASVEQLRDLERGATSDRRHALAEAGEVRTEEYLLIRAAHGAALDGDADGVDWEEVARTALYRRKRASTLVELMQALFTFRRFGVEEQPDRLLSMLDEDDGRRAVEVALRRIKQRALSENVMDIITCGAVPPYGEVLGGKLVAMLLASPRVVSDFRHRYSNRVSLIASGLKGAPVRRRPNLALLTTSSLYAVGSSQYNRIRIPGEILGGSGQVSYRRIGMTESFGTVHVAPDTAAGLALLGRLADDNRRLVNHLFGEGMSPKLRALRGGFEALRLPADIFLRHHSPRLLYGVALAHNCDDLLLGVAERSQYFLRPPRGRDGTAEIAAYWRARWLEPRLQREDVMARLRGNAREAFLLGNELAAADSPERAHGAPHRWLVGEERRQPPPSAAEPSPSEFVERLYRSSNSYADRLNAEELEWVNVDLGLEEYLLEQARAGQQIVVTGNPGDGKTHLIERIRARLEEEGALVLTDANVLRDEEILVAWRTCERERRPMVLAINEWPLFVLRRHTAAAGFAPLAEALRQVQHAIFYDSQLAPAPPSEQVRVVDLSLRNVLARPVVEAVLERLTHDRFYGGLHESDPAGANRGALQSERVLERLAPLLDRVARRGHHATMRQLVGFIAYLLTAGRSPVERLAQQGSHRFDYSTLAFEGGVGPLFAAVRTAFDPAAITHPRHDDALWRGTTLPAAWLASDAAIVGAQHLPEQERIDAYRALKRRFFFEHEAGAELLTLLPGDERTFDALATEGEAGIPTVVRDLLLALNRFFEPDASESEHDALHLWQSHRFDVRSPETFVALHRLGQQAFRIEPPKFAPWVDAWLPAEQRLVRSFGLVAHGKGAVDVSLIVDRNLFLTLAEAQRGLVRASWSRSATRKIIRFVDRLHQLTELEAPVYDIRIRNTETDLDKTFEVQREPPRYLF